MVGVHRDCRKNDEGTMVDAGQDAVVAADSDALRLLLMAKVRRSFDGSGSIFVVTKSRLRVVTKLRLRVVTKLRLFVATKLRLLVAWPKVTIVCGDQGNGCL